MNKTHKIILRRCDSYDPVRIAGIIQEGMQDLGVKPRGNILLKPNAVIAHPESFPNAFTRHEFLDGVLTAVKQLSTTDSGIRVGERSGLTIPTRYCFKQAGYSKVLKKHKIKARFFDEEKHYPVQLNQPDVLRKQIFIPKSIIDTDFLINLPKFKAHPWTRITLSLKNYIGIQDDRHRLVDHNQFLEYKIADLQEVIQPKFIAVDAIIAGEKMMLTPDPFPMGVIMMGTNSCAIDTVGCHMVNLDPKGISYLQLTSKRGFGPGSLDDIEIGGDYPLEELQDKNKNFQFCFEHVDKYFNNTGNLKCTTGTYPEKHSKDYCWGGCPGALQESIHMVKTIQPEVLKEMEKVRYVTGEVTEDLELEEDEKVFFAGDCAAYKGRIKDEYVEIKKFYRTSNEVDESKTHSYDLLKRLAIAMTLVWKNKNKNHIRARGCPVSVADHVHYLSSLGKFKNINFNRRFMLPVALCYLRMHFQRIINLIS